MIQVALVEETMIERALNFCLGGLDTSGNYPEHQWSLDISRNRKGAEAAAQLLKRVYRVLFLEYCDRSAGK